MFTAAGRPGAYLRVITPGAIRAGDSIEVVRQPDHDVTISLAFRATTTERDLLPRLLAAEAYLDDGTIEMVRRREVFLLD
jgi:MOSC domain-containing protein YiiM